METNIKIYPITKAAWLGLGFIVLIAFALRWADLGATVGFRYDQATLSQLALEMAHGENLPLTGIESSAGVPNSPMTVYFLAPLFAISGNPLFVTLCIALWNVVGVALLWGIAQRYFGNLVALIAGLAYAVSPYAIMYSRSIWAQDYHTPIILIGIFCGLLGFLEKRYWAQLLCLPILIIGFQIHFAAWTLLPIYIWFLWIGRKNLKWSALGISFILAIMSMIPFALGIQQQPANTSDRAQLIISILSDGLTFRWYPVEQVANLITGVGRNVPTDVNEGLFAFFYADWFWAWLGVLTLVGLLAVFRPLWRKFAILLWLWAGMTLFAFVPIWTGSGVYPHYFIPSIPAFSLLLALGLVAIINWLESLQSVTLLQLARIGLYGITGLVFLTQGLATLQNYAYSLENYVVDPNSGQTRTPLTYLLDVRDVLQAYDDVILLGANPHESNYYVWEPMLYDTATCVRDLLILDGVIDILPQGAFAVVVAPLHPINANYEVPQRYQHDEPIVVPLRDGEDPYIIYPFEAAPEWTETPMIDVGTHTFDAGLALTGYYLGEDFIRLRWDVLQATGDSYQYFVHFLDETGEKIGQRDAPFYVGQHWCKGDTLITGTLIDLPENTTTIRVGLYSFNASGGIVSSKIIDATEGLATDWLDIPIASD